jgi:hypothetical protein
MKLKNSLCIASSFKDFNTYNSFDCGWKETRISTLAYNLDALFTMNMNFRICGPIHAESMVSSLVGCKVDHEVSPRYLWVLASVYRNGKGSCLVTFMELTVGALYKQQPSTVALSTTEIEYIMVAGQAIREVVVLQKLLRFT